VKKALFWRGRELIIENRKKNLKEQYEERRIQKRKSRKMWFGGGGRTSQQCLQATRGRICEKGKKQKGKGKTNLEKSK